MSEKIWTGILRIQPGGYSLGSQVWLFKPFQVGAFKVPTDNFLVSLQVAYLQENIDTRIETAARFSMDVMLWACGLRSKLVYKIDIHFNRI